MSSSATTVFPSVHGDQVPAESRPILEKVRKGFGFVPNLFAAFSSSPTLLEGYLSMPHSTRRREFTSHAERIWTRLRIITGPLP